MSELQNTPSASASTPVTQYDQLIKNLVPAAAKRTIQFGWDYFKAGVLIVDEWRESVAGENGNIPVPGFLLIREAKIKEKQPDGTKKWVLSDKGKWNLPCGRLQIGENFEGGAFREGREETGYSIRHLHGIPKLLHIGYRADIDNPYVIFIYAAEPVAVVEPPNPEEVAETRWFNRDEILRLSAEHKLRNPDLLLGALDAYCHKQLPVNLITTYPPKT